MKHYMFLNVTQDASEAAINVSYLMAVQILHPDLWKLWTPNQNPNIMAQLYSRVYEAYMTLMNREKRRLYDVQCSQGQLELNAIAIDEQLLRILAELKDAYAVYLRQIPHTSITRMYYVQLEQLQTQIFWQDNELKNRAGLLQRIDQLEHALVAKNTEVQFAEMLRTQQENMYVDRLRKANGTYDSLLSSFLQLSSQHTQLFDKLKKVEADLQQMKETRKRHHAVMPAPAPANIPAAAQPPQAASSSPLPGIEDFFKKPRSNPKLKRPGGLAKIVKIVDSLIGSDQQAWVGLKLSFYDAPRTNEFWQKFNDTFSQNSSLTLAVNNTTINVSYRMGTELAQKCFDEPTKMGQILFDRLSELVEIEKVDICEGKEPPMLRMG